MLASIKIIVVFKRPITKCAMSIFVQFNKAAQRIPFNVLCTAIVCENWWFLVSNTLPIFPFFIHTIALRGSKFDRFYSLFNPFSEKKLYIIIAKSIFSDFFADWIGAWKPSASQPQHNLPCRYEILPMNRAWQRCPIEFPDAGYINSLSCNLFATTVFLITVCLFEKHLLKLVALATVLEYIINQLCSYRDSMEVCMAAGWAKFTRLLVWLVLAIV